MIPANARQIQSINTWKDGQSITIDYLTLTNYVQYDFKGNQGEVYYSLSIKKDILDDDGNIADVQMIPILSGTIQLTDSVTTQWGQDDQVIFNYVANQLNIVLI